MINAFASTLSIAKLHRDNFLKERRKKIFMKNVGITRMKLVPRDVALTTFELVGSINRPSDTLTAKLSRDGIEISFLNRDGERMNYTRGIMDAVESLEAMLHWVTTFDIPPYDEDDWFSAIAVYGDTGSYIQFEDEYYTY